VTSAPSEATSGRIPAQATTPRAGPTLFEIRDEYLSDLAMRVSAKYYIGAKSRLAIMLAQIGNLSVPELEAMDVLRFRNTLKAKGASHATCNSYTHHTFKAMMRWAYEARANPSRRFRGPADTRTGRNAAMNPADRARSQACSEPAGPG